ncbi:hypothetical protein Tco_0221586 [Tanacetum coccineum]
MALPSRELRYLFLRREVYKVQVFDFGGLPDLMAEGLSGRMLRKHKDAQGAILDLDTPGALQFQLGRARRRMSWRQFILAMGLHTDEEMQTSGFGAYWADSARQVPGKGDLRNYWIGISSAGDFLGITPSYTTIRDPILRLCHRLIACTIARRSQAPEKVTVTGLFYLRGMHVDSVNVPYLLVRYLRMFAAGRKSKDHIFGGQFFCSSIGECPVLIRGGTGASGLPVQASPSPPASAKTMPQRIAILEKDVHEILRTLAEQREVIRAMAHDFSRFCTWTTTSLARMMDRAGVTYTSYSETPREYTRRMRRRTGEASTSVA